MKSTTGYTLYSLLYGMTPTQRVKHEVATTRLVSTQDPDLDVATKARTKRIDLLEEAQRLSLTKIVNIQNARKRRYDKKKSSYRNIEAGDKVLLYNQ
jgi:hypothetical protein